MLQTFIQEKQNLQAIKTMLISTLLKVLKLEFPLQCIDCKIYLTGIAILLSGSETASPTYLPPTSKPKNRPRSSAFVVLTKS